MSNVHLGVNVTCMPEHVARSLKANNINMENFSIHVKNKGRFKSKIAEVVSHYDIWSIVTTTELYGFDTKHLKVLEHTIQPNPGFNAQKHTLQRVKCRELRLEDHVTTHYTELGIILVLSDQLLNIRSDRVRRTIMGHIVNYTEQLGELDHGALARYVRLTTTMIKRVFALNIKKGTRTMKQPLRA